MWYGVCFATFASAFILTVLAVPFCRKIARRTGFLDVPKSELHKGHRKATPLLGGAAMFFGWAITIIAGYIGARYSTLFSDKLDFTKYFDGMNFSLRELAVLVFCAFASVVLGLADDKKAMKAQYKFGGQILIALLAVLFGGLKITLFIDTPLITIPFSVFWILFMFNAINFFDNMDGLAVGTCGIAFIFFTIAALVNGQFFVALLGACSTGAACGFWIFNKSLASIFMGDSGSHLIGFLTGVISMKVTYYNPDVASTKFAVLIPLFILAVPIFDTFAVVVIRLLARKPVYIGDHNHISHRFMHMGMSRKRSVQMVHLLALLCGLGALPLLWGDIRTCTVLIIQGAVVFLIMTVLQYAGKKDA